ncbi:MULTISPECIES: aldehyde reductase [unclassified Roseitalea]|uniref:SDR family oxidoreductase n=1 Tax=unclassified Roseitalea TaxID=2639107 RepID=UPI00273D5D7A|nr:MULTISPECIES: aldehyde reductase [unclassified Roseitalea]
MAQRIVLTGASGFIAKHIALHLLRAGYRVHGTVRSMERGEQVREALRPHLDEPALADSHLSFAELDLTRDDGWAEAFEGADALVHTASPFPMAQPDNEDEVIRPAVDGTLRALKAAKAAGITRVVLTSSNVAVYENDAPADGKAFTEADWTDVDNAKISPYSKSKTLAERAAWDFVAAEAPDMKLTSINPGLVLGPALDGNYGTSLRIVERIVSGRDPFVPNFGVPAVDVRDVADMHVAALSTPEAAGKRFLAVNGWLSMPDMARILKKAHPDRKIATRRAPSFLLRIVALFDAETRTIVPNLDEHKTVSNARARQVFGMEFRPLEEAVRASAESVIAHKGI